MRYALIRPVRASKPPWKGPGDFFDLLTRLKIVIKLLLFLIRVVASPNKVQDISASPQRMIARREETNSWATHNRFQ